MAVLILAYRRWENVEKILSILSENKDFTFYVHVDKGRDKASEEDASFVYSKVSRYRDETGLNIQVSRPALNQGIAVSMLAALNRIFEDHTEIIILEDDCVPAAEFISFMIESFKYLFDNDSVALACGTQFAGREIVDAEWVLSRYPLNWGWGINRLAWTTVSQLLLSKQPLKYRRTGQLSRSEVAYWNAGSRRALEGLTDVWDTLLVRELIRHDLRVLLPGSNLVQNNGDEEFATHTRGKQKWTRFPVGTFNKPRIEPEFSTTLDIWLRRKLFRISKRHLISTRITWLIDRTGVRKKRMDLATRVQLAEVNFDL